MKTLFKLAATALLAWVLAAPALAAPPANLSITAERGQPFSLVLDGRLLTRPVAPQVRVGQLLPGRHWADISMPTAYGPPLRFRTELWLQPGLETDYVLVMRPYGPQLRQVGVVPLGRPGYGRGGYYGQQGYGQQGAPYGNGLGGYYGNTQPLPPSQGGYYNGPAGPGYDPRSGYPGQGPQGYPVPPTTPNYPSQQQGYPGSTAPGGYATTPGQGYPDTRRDEGGYDPQADAAGNFRPFEPGELNELAQDLRQQSTDAERLRTATQALDQSSLRADELATLMQAFTHDESRIELARYGYAHLSDPQNFSQVYRALQFNSSIRTLRQAVGLPPQ
jgi:hypothetical protein